LPATGSSARFDNFEIELKVTHHEKQSKFVHLHRRLSIWD